MRDAWRRRSGADLWRRSWSPQPRWWQAIRSEATRAGLRARGARREGRRRERPGVLRLRRRDSRRQAADDEDGARSRCATSCGRMRSWCRSPPASRSTKLAAGLAAGQRIVRVMPNTPCLIGRGASGYSLGPTATAEDGAAGRRSCSRRWVSRYEVPESQLDAVTGLSGSGPAFVYTMIELLAAGRHSGRLAGRIGGRRWPRTRWPGPRKWCSPRARRRPCCAIA